MNAPFPAYRQARRRLSGAELERLVDRGLDAEGRLNEMLDLHRDADLERFLQEVGRRRLKHLLRRLFPKWPILASDIPHCSHGSETRPAPAAAQRVPSKHWRALWFVTLFLFLPKLVVGLVAEPVVTPILARLDNNMAERAETAMRCGDSVILRDAAGNLVGVLPVHAGQACKNTRTHLTAPFEDDTALRIAEAIGVLEGRWARGPLTFLGQDIMGLAKGAAFEAERRLRGLSRSEAVELWLRGEQVTRLAPRGSGPILSAFEALAGQANRVDSIEGKLENIRAATVFVAREMGGDRLARARFLSTRMTAIHGVRTPLAGAVAAEAMFGGPPRTLGEICLFAASSSFHLYQKLPVYGDAVAGRHERAQRRARVCANRLAFDDAERAAAHAYINAFESPTQLLPVLPASAGIVTRDALIAASTSQPSSDTRLLLEIDTQRQGDAEVDVILQELSLRLEPGLCFDGNCAVPVDYLVAIAEIEGEQLPLRMALTNRHRSLLGPFERVSDGIAQPLPPAFGLGSQHKILLALVAARNNEEQLCNRAFGEITNTSGPAPVNDCMDGQSEGWIEIDTSLGISMNLPWIDVARRHAVEIDRLEAALGFLGDPAGPGGAALGIGRRAAPERFMAIFAAVRRAQLGQPARTGGLMVIDDHPVFAVDLEEIGYGRAVIDKLASALAAPLTSRGTLRALPERLESTGCLGVMGKTGTTEIDGGGRARSRSATVVIRCGDRNFVAYAGIESTNATRALGAISARDLEFIISVAVDVLQKPS